MADLEPPTKRCRAAGGERRLLVVGGAGFVLSNVAHRWLEQDDAASVVIFDQARAWDDQARRFFKLFLEQGRVSFFDGDVSAADSWRLLSEQHGRDFTHVVAGAALTPTPEEEKRNPFAIMNVNLNGVLHCLEWARACPRLCRLVHVSSDAVLGVPGLVRRGPAGAADLDDSLPVMSLYATSKVAGEAAVHRWRELFDMDTVSVRFSDVYGRMDRDTGARNRHNAPYWVCRRARAIAAGAGTAAGRKFRVAAGSLDEIGWDYVDAPSVARGMTALLLAPARPQRSVYHLALGRCVSHRELLDAAAGAAGCDVDVELVGSEDIMAAVQGTVDVSTLADPHWLRDRPLDVEPMLSEFGWRASPVKEAVAEYVAWLRSTA